MRYACQQSRQRAHHRTHNTFHNGGGPENFLILFSIFKDTKCFATGKKDDGKIILLLYYWNIILFLEHMTKAALLTYSGFS